LGPGTNFKGLLQGPVILLKHVNNCHEDQVMICKKMLLHLQLASSVQDTRAALRCDLHMQDMRHALTQKVHKLPLQDQASGLQEGSMQGVRQGRAGKNDAITHAGQSYAGERKEIPVPVLSERVQHFVQDQTPQEGSQG